MPFKTGELAALFSSHELSEDQKARAAELRTRCFELAQCIDRSCPDSPHKTTAVRLLEEVSHKAVKSVSLEGTLYPKRNGNGGHA